MPCLVARRSNLDEALVFRSSLLTKVWILPVDRDIQLRQASLGESFQSRFIEIVTIRIECLRRAGQFLVGQPEKIVYVIVRQGFVVEVKQHRSGEIDRLQVIQYLLIDGRIHVGFFQPHAVLVWAEYACPIAIGTGLDDDLRQCLLGHGEHISADRDGFQLSSMHQEAALAEDNFMPWCPVQIRVLRRMYL
jgi:hypothetical protein